MTSVRPGATHVPALAMPARHGCGAFLCRVCAGHGMTEVHFAPDGICAYGHRLHIPVIRGTDPVSEAEAELASRLAPWIEQQGITKDSLARAVAGSLVTSGGAEWAAAELAAGSQVLRDAAAGLASGAGLGPGEWAAENREHFARDLGRSWP